MVSCSSELTVDCSGMSTEDTCKGRRVSGEVKNRQGTISGGTCKTCLVIVGKLYGHNYGKRRGREEGRGGGGEEEEGGKKGGKKGGEEEGRQEGWEGRRRERRKDQWRGGLMGYCGTRAYLHPCACQRCAAYHRRHSALTDLCLLPWLCVTSEDSVTQCSTARVEVIYRLASAELVGTRPV